MGATGGCHQRGISSTSFTNSFGRVWVYTGPIFAEAVVSPIGIRSIPVPSAFYNVIVRETETAGGPVGTPKVLALITPHSTTIWDATLSTPAYRNLTLADCWKYVTTVDRVQALTGLTFFPSPASPLSAEFTSTVDVRGWGTTLENGIGKPNVHIIEPSWDSTYNLGLPLTTVKVKTGTINQGIKFIGQATTSGTGTASTIASTTWTFGDGTTDNTPNTTHVYATPGDYTVTFTATDGADVSNTVSRRITIISDIPSAPSISLIADTSTNDTTTKTITFTVTDDATVASSINVTATSDTPSVLADSLVVKNTNGTCTLDLKPIASSLGTSKVTVTAINAAGLSSTQSFTLTVIATPNYLLNETFEQGSRASYTTAGNTDLKSGTWTFTQALLGKDTADIKNGTQAVRFQKKVAGSLAMTFPVTNPTTVNLSHALYGTSTGSAVWGLYYSINGGAWTQAGTNVTTTSHTLTTTTFPVNLTGSVLFRVQTDATSTIQLNLDDFQIQ